MKIIMKHFAKCLVFMLITYNIVLSENITVLKEKSQEQNLRLFKNLIDSAKNAITNGVNAIKNQFN